MSQPAPSELTPRPLGLPRLDERAQVVACLASILVGCALRALWVAKGHLAPLNSEAFFLARALAEGRGFSEAFGLGTGPTAHLMPTTPLVSAGVYSLLGVATPAAESILVAWALLQFSVSIFLAERVMRELGVSAWARLAGVVAVCVLPLQFNVEAQLFRVWEAGLATCAFLGILLAVLRLDRRETIGRRPLLALGAANGLTFLVSPAAAIATSGVIGLLFLRRVPVLGWIAPVLAAVAVCAVVLVPWGLRNEAALGKFIPLRTGAGISLALGYNETRLHADDRQADDLMRFKQVSPLMGEAARRHYVAVGEVAYNTELRQAAQAWIRANPGEAWSIRARNLFEFYAPPKWFWTRFTAGGDLPLLSMRQGVIALSALIGAVTLVVGLAARRRGWFYLASALLLPSLPYIATFPQLRYRYLISTLLIILAAEGVLWFLDWLRRQTTRRRALASSA